ncbi:cytochrome D1 domain-containing protein, partial [Castellaniella sp.]|uniref:cytochrome D1 domain-containing protein n=1 Tax=Castellaniella sp. TaxID=1955812 RepID=UPI00355D5B28
MKRPLLSLAIAALLLGGCAHSPQTLLLRGTGDLGVVVERATGTLQLIESSTRTSLARIDGLGDLSHASVVFSRDQRYAYVFGRDGGLTKVDLLLQKVEQRVIQAGNSIGGAISSDG